MKYTIDNSKPLLRLLERYVRLEAVDKLSLVLSFALIAGVVFALGVMTVFCLVQGLVDAINAQIGNLAYSYFIVAGGLLLIIILFCLLRNKIVVNPVVSFFAKRFFPDEEVSENGGVR